MHIQRNNTRCAVFPQRVLLPASVAILFGYMFSLSECFAASREWVEGPLLPEASFEPNSPIDLIPAGVEGGLSNTRSIPSLPPPPPPPQYPQLFRLTRPYYDSILLNLPPSYLPPPDPSTFRPVIAHQPPIGLQPRKYRAGAFEVYPTLSLAHSFDSNVDLTPDDPIADFYVTPRAKIELQLGTPDSVWIERYETILGLNLTYEMYGELFSEHPRFNAFNQKLSLTTRIGRTSAIWRPYLYFSDETGTNLLTTELTNRTRRINVSTGIQGEYKLTSMISARQRFGYSYFGHTDPAYINFNAFETRQELGYRTFNETNTFCWAGFRHTNPDRGSSGNEAFAGLGWRGKLDPRLFSELSVGYGTIDLADAPPGAVDASGLRIGGYTTFQWGPRFAFTLIYDRNYIFNELSEFDNYISTLFQFKGEFYLGDNWYVTPYFAVGFNEFQVSRAVTAQYRPELEISYAFPNDTNPNSRRVFLKIAYSHSENLKGVGPPIDGARASLGFAWAF